MNNYHCSPKWSASIDIFTEADELYPEMIQFILFWGEAALPRPRKIACGFLRRAEARRLSISWIPRATIRPPSNFYVWCVSQ